MDVDVTASTVVDPSSYPEVRPARVFMVHAHFNDAFVSDILPDQAAFFVDLGLSRISEVELTVILTVSTTEDSPYQLSVSYAADFIVSDAVPENARDEIWRHAAYELGPSLLYPYIREAYTNFTSRSRLGTQALPFLPIPLETPEDNQEIPPPPLGSDYQQALPLDLVTVDERVAPERTLRPATRKRGSGQTQPKRDGK